MSVQLETVEEDQKKEVPKHPSVEAMKEIEAELIEMGSREINDKNIIELKKILRPLRVIRSVELVTIAYEKGLLDRYVFDEEKKIIPNLEKELLEASLWALKLNGCSVSDNEIKQIIKLESQ